MVNLNRRQLALFGGGVAAAIAGVSCTTAATVPLPVTKGKPLDYGDVNPLDYVDAELRPMAERMYNSPMGEFVYSDETVFDMRPGGAAFAPDPLPDIVYEKRNIPGPSGAPDVEIFIVNAKAGESRPAILHMHGGGFILGEAEWELNYLQTIAKDLDCVIVSVNYRLAPEHTYQDSVEDNYTGLKWLHSNADTLGVDRTRIAVMGESAGGGHAALLALAARDRGEIPLVLQVLIYPMLDDRTGSTRDVPPFIGAIGWKPDANVYGWKSFLGEEPGGPTVSPAGVPARVEDLRGLAPTFIGVGTVDLFAYEDIEYAQNLVIAGVPTELVVVPGAYHGFDRAWDTKLAQKFNKAKMNALRKAFGQPQKV